MLLIHNPNSVVTDSFVAIIVTKLSAFKVGFISYIISINILPGEVKMCLNQEYVYNHSEISLITIHELKLHYI